MPGGEAGPGGQGEGVGGAGREAGHLHHVLHRPRHVDRQLPVLPAPAPALGPHQVGEGHGGGVAAQRGLPHHHQPHAAGRGLGGGDTHGGRH